MFSDTPECHDFYTSVRVSIVFHMTLQLIIINTDMDTNEENIPEKRDSSNLLHPSTSYMIYDYVVIEKFHNFLAH